MLTVIGKTPIQGEMNTSLVGFVRGSECSQYIRMRYKHYSNSSF